jgi:hypothetical protein
MQPSRHPCPISPVAGRLNFTRAREIVNFMNFTFQ